MHITTDSLESLHVLDAAQIHFLDKTNHIAFCMVTLDNRSELADGWLLFCTLWPVTSICIYRSLAKKGPWAEHLTSLPKRGVGALLTVSAFNHERVSTSCLQWLEALGANNWTQNNIQHNHQRLWSRVLMAPNTLNCTMWQWVYCSSRLVLRLPWGCSPH